jgi:anti-sigma B factor antagonist
MSAPLQIAQRVAAGIAVFELSGHLVFDEGDRIFRDQVKAFAAAGGRRLIVDLSRVSYVDSGGVGSLVEMYLHLMKRGGQLKILRPSVAARRVLEITQLDSVLEIFGEEEHAIRSFDMRAMRAG